jgi:hypothetical protein
MTSRCCTSLLYETERAGLRWADTGSELGGRYWDRTSIQAGVAILAGTCEYRL